LENFSNKKAYLKSEDRTHMSKNDTSSQVLVNGAKNIGKAKDRYLEDFIKYGSVSTRSGLQLTLGVVADGIGGENAGERAATLTSDGVFEYCEDSRDTNIPEMLEAALIKVNAIVYKDAQERADKKNMGSTAAVAAIHDNHLYIANAGDSRIYLVRDNKITQLTVDHTWEHEVVQAGKLSWAEAARHPRRDELVRSIGYEPTLVVDLGLYFQNSETSEVEDSRAQGLPLLPGDRVIVCSDGLVKSLPGAKGHFVEHSEIIKIVTETPNSDAPNQLIQKALDRNVDDNVSVIVMEVPGGKRPLRLSRPVLIIATALLMLSFLVLKLLPGILNPSPPPLAPLPTILQDQIFISQIWNTSLQILSTDNISSQPSQGDLLDFKSGETITTTGGNEGYAYIGFPGQVEVYLAGGTEIFIKDPNDTQTKFDIVLNHGSILVNLPPTFPAGQRFLVETPTGSQAWISGSMIGLQYDPSTFKLYVDCLQDICGYLENALSQSLPQGSHIVLIGMKVISIGPGTRNELWQFIPDLVPTPTLTPSATPNVAATQACRYYQSLGTPCPPPK
jgi:PPM family protein phosphatase